MSRGKSFAKGHDSRRQKRAPKMPEEREAIRLIKEGSPKAVQALMRLLESADEKIVLGAAKAIIDKVIVPEAMANPWQVPDELLEKSPEEQLAWALRQEATLANVVAQLKAAVDGGHGAN